MKKTLLGLMISRRLINQKVETFKKYLRDGRPNSVYENLQTVTWNLTKAISSLKRVYYERIANKLNDSNTSSKVYWSTIKTLANGKKVPVIPRILVHKKLVTDFKDKNLWLISTISSVNNVNLYQKIAPSHQFRLLKLPIDLAPLILIRRKC